jgi:lactam utilization protein B
MNILPTCRNHPALAALAIAVPLVLLAGRDFRLPGTIAPAVPMDRSVNFDGTGVGMVDELQSVRFNLAGAQRALAMRDYQRAGQLAEEARVDALVAEHRAQSTRTRKSAQELQNAARMLRAEIAEGALGPAGT